ncbi:MAG: glutamate-5-semialdehyde dehydrogenase [Candidatus Sericytochromatia bacterium]
MKNNIEELLINTQKASYDLSTISKDKINNVLNDLADLIIKRKELILTENKKDLDLMDKDNPKYDRLKLNSQRIDDISKDIKNVSNLEYPVGKLLSEKELSNGLKLKKISVAIGVIGIIYESRPNVTLDVFCLCLKSGNACVLKGGKEADYSNRILVSLIKEVLKNNKLNPNIVSLMDNDRDSMNQVLNSDKYIDVIIPRGSQELINYVRKNSTIPVIETGAGIVHTYIDEDADIEISKKVVFNAKTRRPSVCNSLDTLIIHKEQLKNLAFIVSSMNNKVEIFADEYSYKVLKEHYNEGLLKLANESDFGIEFLSLKMSIKTVDNINQALEHIQKYSSKHSEAIISKNQENINLFLKKVDAAALYVNTSTSFTDGGQFGMGAEIGISTQKLHARGPMALEELTSYKWIITGNGQIRE